jgi:CRISPR/Cas system-associated exonuclease Cas4 (RecB family)
MSDLVSLFMMIAFIIGIVVLLVLHPRAGFATTGMKMRRAVSAPWSLAEFLKLASMKWNLNQYYSFSEDNVRSLGHRYVGRLDSAILHWDKIPILDLVIEYKFPVKHLPRHARKEDEFQAGLYALALLESGVSCSSTRLVTIYCLQRRAKRCLERKSLKECWQCRNGRTFVTRFKPKNILRTLRGLDEVWYEGRKPIPIQQASRCRVCPYSDGRCNYAVV